MSELAPRPLYVSRPAQAMLPYVATVSMGESLSALWETPQLSGLASMSMDVAGAGESYTEEQRDRLVDNLRNSARLSSALQITPPGDERDRILLELDRLREEQGVVHSEETQRSIEEGRLVDQEVLTETYGDLLTFDRPMTPEAAKLLYDNKKAEVIRNAIISRGPEGFVSGALHLGVGFLDVATDPLELTIGIAANAILPVVGTAARLGPIGGRVAQGVIEGAVTGAISEPLYYGMSKQMQLDYDMYDALQNIALGAMLGGTIGAVGGALHRFMGPTPETVVRGAEVLDIASSHDRDMANVALRQMLNDEPVNLFNVISRDLRTTTTLSRVDGITFQRHVVPLPERVSADIRPTTLIMGGDKTPFRYPTVQAAQQAADAVGGKIVRQHNNLHVVRPVAGDLLRDPRGDAVTFTTARQAQKTMDSMKKSGAVTPDVAVVRIPGVARPVFAIAENMTPDDISALERGFKTIRVPKGIDTRTPTVLPDANARLDQAVKGVAAYRKMSQDLAKASQDANAPPTKTAIDQDGRVDVDAELRKVEEQTAELEAALVDAKLSAGQKQEMAEMEAELVKLEARKRGIEAFTNCRIVS